MEEECEHNLKICQDLVEYAAVLEKCEAANRDVTGIDMKPQMEASLPAGLHPQASQDIEQFEAISTEKPAPEMKPEGILPCMSCMH